jgi:hypothetical protein
MTTLNSDEAAAILRRAAELEDELDAARGDMPDGIDMAALEQAAGEVGISVEAVRQAYAELQVGGIPPEEADRRHPAVRPTDLMGPARVAEQRVIRLPVDVVRDRIGRLLRQQTFELRRSTATSSLWRRREDFTASIKRGFDVSKKIKLTDARAVRVNLTEVIDRDGEPATLVRAEADLGQVRTGAAAASLAIPTGVMASLAGIGAIAGEPAAVVTAAAGWLPLMAGSIGIGHVLYRKQYLKVGEVLGMYLDGLEG